MLYVVSTPIGNLGDMTLRAIETLKNVDLIACEDTRVSGKLFKKYEITTNKVSYHDKNKKKVAPKLLAFLLEGKSIALVSDAGTPGISDPGFYLIREAIDAGISISPVPGASALLSALVASGCPTDQFHFSGFLPKTEKKRRDVFTSLESIEYTFICYESRYRIRKTLEIVGEILPKRHLCVGREITKMHEEFLRGSAHTILKDLPAQPKGEFVVIIAKHNALA